MKLTIVHSNLEVSGTFKYIVMVARGFRQLGWDVQLIYSGENVNAPLVRFVLGSIPAARLAGRFSEELSRAVASVPIRLFASHLFTPDQSPNFVGMFSGRRRFLRLVSDSDLVIYSNPFAFPPWLLLRQNRPRSILLFHEGIDTAFLPRLLRVPLQAYLRQVSRSVTGSVSLTLATAKRLAQRRVQAWPIYHGFEQPPPSSTEREDLVLADSRWNAGRDPSFVVELATRVPTARFVLCGKIGSEALRAKLRSKMADASVADRVQVKERFDEAELAQLYRRAKIAVRWGEQEDGFPFSLVQAVSYGCVPILSRELGGAYYLAREVSPDLAVDGADGFARAIARLLNEPEFYQEMRDRVDTWRRRRPWTTVCSELWHFASDPVQPWLLDNDPEG